MPSVSFWKLILTPVTGLKKKFTFYLFQTGSPKSTPNCCPSFRSYLLPHAKVSPPRGRHVSQDWVTKNRGHHRWSGYPRRLQNGAAQWVWLQVTHTHNFRSQDASRFLENLFDTQLYIYQELSKNVKCSFLSPRFPFSNGSDSGLLFWTPGSLWGFFQNAHHFLPLGVAGLGLSSPSPLQGQGCV